VKVEMDSAPEAPDHIHICTESSNNRPNLDSVATIKSADLPTAVGDSSPRTELQSLPAHSVLRFPYSPSTPPSRFNKVDAPSVREEQRPHSQPSPLPYHSPVPRTQEAYASLPAVPNPSTSVFAVNFPMLARPKPPSEVADIPPPRKPSTEAFGEPSIAIPGMVVLIIV